MPINPSEVTKLLKDQIKNFGEKAEVSEIGKVLSVGDGIARVYGLDNVQAGEMVEFDDGSKGMALNLKPIMLVWLFLEMTERLKKVMLLKELGNC